MLPLKFAKRWPWENTWLLFSVLSLVVLPWSLALNAVPHLYAVYAGLPVTAFILPLVLGFGWGIAQVLFGLSIVNLGMALGYAIIVGLGAALGTLVPILVMHREILVTRRGFLVMAGVAIMIAGIWVCASAGQMREGPARSTAGTKYATALLLAIICGVMAPMLNYAFAFGQSIAEQARIQGVSPQSAGYAIWPIALAGGLVPNVFYAALLLSKNRTWKCYTGAWRRDGWVGGAMAVLWMAAFALYGVSSTYLGSLGTSIGWALFQIFMIMTANAAGLLGGEWSTAPAGAKRLLWAGFTLLTVAIIVMGAGNG